MESLDILSKKIYKHYKILVFLALKVVLSLAFYKKYLKKVLATLFILP